MKRQPAASSTTTTAVTAALAPVQHKGSSSLPWVLLAVLALIATGFATPVARRRARMSHLRRTTASGMVGDPATREALMAARNGGDPAAASGDAATAVLPAALVEPSDSRPPVRHDDERQMANGEPTDPSDLGQTLERSGDLEGALAAYRYGDAGGDAGAATNLGVLLEQRGDIDGALAAYRRADQRGDVSGSFNLGCLLAEHGDVAGAIAALRRADDGGDAAGASNLGVLLERQGDRDGALAAYRRADERGDANGSFNLGLLLTNHDDLAAAQEAYGRAAERGDAEVIERARAELAKLADAQAADVPHLMEQSPA